jgi:hypothetical protein
VPSFTPLPLYLTEIVGGTFRNKRYLYLYQLGLSSVESLIILKHLVKFGNRDSSIIVVTRLQSDRLCGLVVRVLGCRSGGPGSIPGTTRIKGIGSGTGFTQPREYN